MLPQLLIEAHYLPCIAYMQLAAKYHSLTFEANEHFEKQSYRNRCYIYGANGKHSLIIPVVKKSEKIPIKDIQISYTEKWQHTHFVAIKSAYNSSPYFSFYEEELKKILQKKEKYLLDYNLFLFSWITSVLKIKLSLFNTHTYEKEASLHQEDYRGVIHPKKTLLIEHPAYAQVFSQKHGYIPNLSIIDWIFNDLPAARNFFNMR